MRDRKITAADFLLCGLSCEAGPHLKSRSTKIILYDNVDLNQKYRSCMWQNEKTNEKDEI